MAHIKRKYIDTHWGMFLVRGGLALLFGCLVSFGDFSSILSAIPMIGLCLLLLGIVDTVGALFNSLKKHGWITSVIDALIDVVAALSLFFYAQDSIVNCLIILAVYTFLSGIIDLFHSFLSTVDPTDRFIRALIGCCGCVIGIVILNSGSFESSIFIRFFGTYLTLVGVTSLIYGVHNRSQKIEDKIARKESAKKKSVKKR